MAVIKYKSGDKVELVVTRADNVLVGYLGETAVLRRQIYGRMTDYNPSFCDTIDIGPSLRQASESLLMTGTNFTGGGMIAFSIVVNGATQARVNDDLPVNSSKSWEFTFQKS